MQASWNEHNDDERVRCETNTCRISGRRPITRSLAKLQNISIPDTLFWAPVQKPKRSKAQGSRSRARFPSKKKKRNYVYFVKQHSTLGYVGRQLSSPKEVVELHNNIMDGSFIMKLTKAYNLVRRSGKPYNARRIYMAVSGIFIGTTPHEFEFAVRQLTNVLIRKEGVLSFLEKHGLEFVSDTQIVKEECHKRAEHLEPEQSTSHLPTVDSVEFVQ